MRLVSAIYGEYYPFDQFVEIDDTLTSDRPDDLRKGDALVVWGGADISPTFYNKPRSKLGSGAVPPSRRDAIEWAMMQRAVELDVPILGVCRGGQMLCALAGGHLVQDINGHLGQHEVETYDGREFFTNSIHHQMMYPWNVEHEMLASVKKLLSTDREGKHYYVEVDNCISVPEEPEFVYFPKVRGFAIQWHPEGMSPRAEATKFIQSEFTKRV